MNTKKGFTLIELAVVVTITGVVMMALFNIYVNSQASNALKSTTELIANDVSKAHVFARESKETREWGLVREDNKSYSIRSRVNENSSMELDESKILDRFVTLPDDFEIWFEKGTGNTENELRIRVKNILDKEMFIVIHTSGLVEIEN